MKKILIPLTIIGILLIIVTYFSISKQGRKHDVSIESFVRDTTLEKMQDIIIIGTPDNVEKDSSITIIGNPKSDDNNNQTTDEYSKDVFEYAKLENIIPEQIIVKTGYIISYNCSTKNANWVAWHLTNEHTTGAWSRNGIQYMVDNEVKGPRQEIEDWDNISLPIDHGHLCPAGDNKWSEKAMFDTFYLTNMCPQNSNLNRGDWEELERKCRGWAKHYGDIYIVAGPIFYSSNYKTIGNNVGVPDAFFKIVLCKTKKPKALGFIYANDGTHHKIDHYVMPVDEVEKITGINFFPSLPDDIEAQIESSSNIQNW